MILTTTPAIEGHTIREYKGAARQNAMDEMAERARRMGANAVVGIDGKGC